jgi:hypothetical protein
MRVLAQIMQFVDRFIGALSTYRFSVRNVRLPIWIETRFMILEQILGFSSVWPHRRDLNPFSSKRSAGSSPAPGTTAAKCGPRQPSPAACAIKNSPAPMMTAPIARATRSPAGARRSMVMAAVMTAIARRSITPTIRRTAVRLAQQ